MFSSSLHHNLKRQSKKSPFVTLSGKLVNINFATAVVLYLFPWLWSLLQEMTRRRIRECEFWFSSVKLRHTLQTNNINHLVKPHRVVWVHLFRKLQTRCPIVAELSLGDWKHSPILPKLMTRLNFCHLLKKTASDWCFCLTSCTLNKTRSSQLQTQFFQLRKEGLKKSGL